MESIDQFVQRHKSIVILGYADVGKSIRAMLEKHKEKIVFADNSSKKQGMHGTDYVFALQEAHEKFPEAGYIAASVWHSRQMEEQLMASGVQAEHILEKLPDQILQKEKERAHRLHMPRKSLTVQIDITKHCNLKCKGCDHFAPVAEEEYLSPDEFGKDMRRLSEVFHCKAEWIVLMGGEPLLHPQIAEFLRPARENFPDAKIQIFTNGMLLKKMKDDFWRACAEYRIGICPTRYPIPLDYDDLEKFVKDKGVAYEYVGSSESGRMLWKEPLDLSGSQDMEESFYACRIANDCLTLEHGRLYTCSIAPNIAAFNKAFGKNVPLTEKDGIDIYQAKSAEEILAAMAKPIPFCKYCDVKRREYDLPWTTSKGSIEEWT